MTPTELAKTIWKAGVHAVGSTHLTSNAISSDGDQLTIAGRKFATTNLRHIEIVGAGKAGKGMVAGCLEGLRSLNERVSISGWVNVPQDCSGAIEDVRLHAARLAGINEPRTEGVAGTQEILRRIASLTDDDLCLVLISGGGSALLPAPVAGISLDDKLRVTQTLAAAGATIQELNSVRRELSLVKGGRLLAGCKAPAVALIVSDVIGDPLDLIASGPTVDRTPTPEVAASVLKKYDPQRQLPAAVYNVLSQPTPSPPTIENNSCHNAIIGSNIVAVEAAANAARQQGLHVINLGSENSGLARDLGPKLFRELQQARDAKSGQGVCVLAGGETTVELVEADRRGRGGRNQDVVLSAIANSFEEGTWQGLALLSGGTDGEDGPTDAAGAYADGDVIRRFKEHRLLPAEYLGVNNAYSCFDAVDALVKTGPTHTNVMDLAVGVFCPPGDS